MPLDIDVRGLEEAKRKLEQVAEDIHGRPMVNAMRQATALVTRDAKRFAPVDTGALRSSITPEVRDNNRTLQGVVGSNKAYAPYMELGTGTPAGRPPHRPPVTALREWSRRHGISAYLVARAIARRGGLEPRRFLQRAVEQNRERIIDLFNGTVRRIVEE